MAPIIVVALLIGLPTLITFLLRANASIVFLALCAGSVLTRFISGETTNILSSFTKASTTVNSSVTQISFLFAPAFFTAVFMRKSVSGTKAMMNLIPAAATGIVGFLLAAPLLPGGIQHNITGTNVWSVVEQYQGVIVAVAVVVSLFTLWISHSKRSGKTKH